MNFKYILFGMLLMIGAAFAFTISSPEPVKAIQKGEVAIFEIVLAGNANVDLSLETDVPSSISERFVRVEGEEVVHVVVYTDTVPHGFYGIKVIADVEGAEYTYQLSVGVGENEEANFKLDAVFDELVLVPGEDAELRFILRNMDDQPVKNIIIKSDIFKSLEPQYPNYISLQPQEEEEFEILISVSNDFEEGDYTFTVIAAAGNVEVQEEIAIEVLEKNDLSDAVSLRVSSAWEPMMDEEENIIGYKIPFTVENDETLTMRNVEIVLSGAAADWQLNGDNEFNLDPLEEKELELEVKPTNFDDVSVKMRVRYDGATLASKTVQFAGYKVGAPTGFFFMGGSLTIGILLVVIIVLIVLYIRQRNLHEDEVEDVKTKTYLKDLVDKTKKETKSPRRK